MKIFFITSSHSPLAESDNRLIEDLHARAREDGGAEVVDSPNEAEVCVLVERFSFKTWRYIEQLQADAIVGKFPEKVYTVNFDDAANGLLKGLYTSLPRRRFYPHRHRAIPYAKYPNALVSDNIVDQAPSRLASFRGNLKSNSIRQKLFAAYRGHREILIEATESWMNHGEDEKQHYVKLLQDAKFSLCPSGWAPVSFRIFESMALARCPVIISDDYVAPANIPWSEFALFIPTSGLRELGDILRREEPHAGAKGQRAQEVWRQNFSPEQVANYYWRELKSLFAEPDLRQRDDERAHWKSNKVFRANGWSLDQRLFNKMGQLLRRGR